uniref:Uncharacterized protein n=1 Tax=Arundo donax TaxID=35708 RepID=A0A0A9H7G0_ARUDO
MHLRNSCMTSEIPAIPSASSVDGEALVAKDHRHWVCDINHVSGSQPFQKTVKMLKHINAKTQKDLTHCSKNCYISHTTESRQPLSLITTEHLAKLADKNFFNVLL